MVPELGLSLYDAQAASEAGLQRESYFFSGKHDSDMDVVKEMTPVLARVELDAKKIATAEDLSQVPEAIELDRTSLAAYLDRIGASGWPRKLLEVAYITEYGLEPGEQSSLNFIDLISTDLAGGRLEIYGDSDERYTVHGGAERIPDALRARIADQLHLGHALRALRAREGGYRLSFDLLGGGSAEVDADLVVLALPFSVLRDIELQVDLPPRKLAAIRELGYGQNAKILCGFKNRLWRDQKRSGYIYTDEGFQAAWDNSRQQPGMVGGLTLFLGGRMGLDAGTGASMDRAMALLPGVERAFPGAAATFNGRVGRFHWPSHGLSKGSYSCYRPGQWIGIGGAEGEAVGRLLFCGEHTSVDFQGFMEGAAESGQRAAMEARSLLERVDKAGQSRFLDSWS